MKPPQFEYFAPDSVEETLSLLSGYGETGRVLAGGQSLVPLLNLRLLRAEQLIDINRVPGLAGVARDSAGFTLGALTRQRAVERSREIAEVSPLLVEAVRHIGYPATRTRGTVGGSIAFADPAAEIPAVWLALDGRAQIASTSGSRTVGAREFFRGASRTALAPGELLNDIWFRTLGPGEGWSFQEVSRRQGSRALVGAIALLSLAGDTVRDSRVVLFGSGDRPNRAIGVEERLVGNRAETATFAQAAAGAARDAGGSDDDYARRVAPVLVRRALAEAAGRAQHTAG